MWKPQDRVKHESEEIRRVKILIAGEWVNRRYMYVY